jgi:hypothetical protein
MTALLTSLLLLAPPGTAQDSQTLEARRAEIVRLVIEHGRGRFAATDRQEDRPEAWLMLNSAGKPSYAEGSLEYAAALLMAGEETERAARIIDTVLAAQAQGGKCPGGFPWTPDGAADSYATAYLAPWLAYLKAHHSEQLPEATRTGLEAALRPALGAVQRLSVQPADGLPFLARLAAQATLGAALGDAAVRAKAAADLEAWSKLVGASGLPCLQQPTATAMTAAALNWAWCLAPSEEARSAAGAALEYLYRDLALRSLPSSGTVAGAVIGGHLGDYALGAGAARYLVHAQYGRPAILSAEPFALFLALPGYAVGGETAQLAAAGEAPRTVRAQTADAALATFVHPAYALGTMSGPVGAGTMPVVLTYGSGKQPGAWCAVSPLPARVAAVQDGRRALVNFDVDDVGFEDDRLFVVGEFHLGLRSELDAVLVNQARYTEEFAVALETRGSVVTERDGVYTAVIPVVMGPATVKAYDQPVGPAELAWSEPNADGDRELVLKLSARSIRAREQSRNNYRIGLAIEMATRDEYPTAEAFAAVVYNHRRVRQETKSKRVKVGEKTDNPHRPRLYTRPVERGDWIFETRIVQDMTFVGETPGDTEEAPPKETFSLELTEDLEQNLLAERLVNDIEQLWDFIYRSPALNHEGGDALATVLRSPPAEPAPPLAPQ